MTDNLLFTIGFVVLLLLAGALAIWKVRISERDLGGSIGTMVAPAVLSVYLLVAAMAIVIGWESNNAARDLTVTEATAATDTYWAVQRLPEPQREEAAAGVRDYLSTVVNEDWPRMRDGDMSQAGDSVLAGLRATVAETPEAAPDDYAAADRASAIMETGELLDIRTERANTAGSNIPVFLVIVTALLGLAVAVLPFASGNWRSRADMFWCAVNFVLVVATLVILVSLDNPYAGMFPVGPGPLQDSLDGFDTIDAAVSAQ
ncbi:DUF4239 domain-containing protein [Allonocardiopsis opalescens]|uniref:Uncharacterized protein DUF4239 n=1 Tax=Allonocardiopsis opalescens TaxID=1144618 RepID=A0A2T0Q9H4_9ACTN|nr:DUF4239 domain-containing protein [Allonocardiopsis opalescens]PRY00495.1 uncharacterized protein DUF4239 [Allonocardiopsis opalescens]